MDIELFNYELPEELIAQTPAQKRDECRLLVVNRHNDTYEDKVFKNIINYLQKGDIIVRTSPASATASTRFPPWRRVCSAPF